MTGIIHKFGWRHWEKPQNRSAVWTQDIPNKKQVCYPLDGRIRYSGWHECAVRMQAKVTEMCHPHVLSRDRAYYQMTAFASDNSSYFCWSYLVLSGYGTVFLTKRDTNASKQSTACIFRVLVFWIMTPCSLVYGYQRFGGNYCLHLHDPWTWR
jgi:hypothetical protein